VARPSDKKAMVELSQIRGGGAVEGGGMWPGLVTAAAKEVGGATTVRAVVQQGSRQGRRRWVTDKRG
jgi:hypothetical protein